MEHASLASRNKTIRNLKTWKFDVLVIGGGITGAGIALDAALRGLKTGLIEKNDFAYGTSSRSTKLIHGGLRYLKQLEFGLVKEVGSERAVVHRLAPHLVVPEKMLLPLYEKRGFGSLLTSFGLKLYDWLAGVKAEDRRRMLTKRQTLNQEPLLRKDDVKGGALYAEYRTDDARLTMEIIKSAAEHGVQLINYCKATDFVYQEEKIAGVKAQDGIENTEFEIKAVAVVSAAGPWVDELREIDHSKKGKRLHLTKGVHLVFAREKLPISQAIYFDVEDGRMIFAIPRGRISYVGTTDTNYTGNQDSVRTLQADVDYLIQGVNRAFPSVNLSASDIESSWAGLRPLIHEEGKSASELSRKDEIFESPSGLISIAGGKLTGYRKMAERVVDLVIGKFFVDQEFKACETDRVPLVRPGFKNYDEVSNYIKATAKQLQAMGLPETYSGYLVGNYGQHAGVILKDIATGDPERELARAELRFTLAWEMVMKPTDFFVRRTGMLYFYKKRMDDMKEIILNEFRSHFQWSEAQFEREKEALEITAVETLKF
jgi:glycerol-3-phosphate dehydrogenase